MRIFSAIRYGIFFSKLFSSVADKDYHRALDIYSAIKKLRPMDWRSDLLAAEAFHGIGRNENANECAASSISGIFHSSMNSDEKSHLFIYIFKKLGTKNPLIVQFFENNGGFFEPNSRHVRRSIQRLAPLK
jgi:hypothetical protein